MDCSDGAGRGATLCDFRWWLHDEEKIKDRSDNELSYREIKEKIVQRVIPFVSDYEEVVSNSIELMSCGIEYKGLLRKNEKLLVKFLSAFSELVNPTLTF